MTRSEWKAAARARLGGGIFKDQWLMGLGVMLAAGEIPRIAGMFGLETAARPNINGVINTAQSAVHLTQMIRTVAK